MEIGENAEVNSVYKVVARVENGEAKEAGSYRAELWTARHALFPSHTAFPFSAYR